MTSDNFALPAGGIRRPHLRRLTRWGRRRCGSAWSLSAMCAPRSFKNQYPDSENANVTRHTAQDILIEQPER